jgi:hypothetical protein
MKTATVATLPLLSLAIPSSPEERKFFCDLQWKYPSVRVASREKDEVLRLYSNYGRRDQRNLLACRVRPQPGSEAFANTVFPARLADEGFKALAAANQQGFVF